MGLGRNQIHKLYQRHQAEVRRRCERTEHGAAYLGNRGAFAADGGASGNQRLFGSDQSAMAPSVGLRDVDAYNAV